MEAANKGVKNKGEHQLTNIDYCLSKHLISI